MVGHSLLHNPGKSPGYQATAKPAAQGKALITEGQNLPLGALLPQAPGT